MSRYLKEAYRTLTPYEPGEQPQNRKYIKLNTNESPFPPSAKAIKAAVDAAEKLELYPDPDSRILCDKLAERINIDNGTSLKKENILVSNGSDEVLNFAFLAFCDENTPAVFPDITYGFYPVFADMNLVPYETIPLDEEFRINPEDYEEAGGTVFIANPNAHIGSALSVPQIEEILKSNSDNVVVIDEAYVDFGAESSVKLVEKYDNLLVTQTFSKSRSMAGARLGFGVANAALIQDLNTVRNSTNPYNINTMTMAAGIGMLDDDSYMKENCRRIMECREYVEAELKKMGFELTDSISNFIFMRHPGIDGGWLYEELKKEGILVRHFTKERISQYNRVTIGSIEQMKIFIEKLKVIADRAV